MPAFLRAFVTVSAGAEGLAPESLIIIRYGRGTNEVLACLIFLFLFLFLFLSIFDTGTAALALICSSLT